MRDLHSLHFRKRLQKLICVDTYIHDSSYISLFRIIFAGKKAPAAVMKNNKHMNHVIFIIIYNIHRGKKRLRPLRTHKQKPETTHQVATSSYTLTKIHGGYIHFIIFSLSRINGTLPHIYIYVYIYIYINWLFAETRKTKLLF